MSGLTQGQKLALAAGVSIVAIFWLFSSFFAAIVGGLIAAYTFFPVYKWLNKKLHKRGASAALTLFCSFLVVFIPLFFVLLISVGQVKNIIEQLTNFIDTGSIPVTTEGLIERINEVLTSMTNGRITVTPEQLEGTIANAAKSVGEFFLSIVQEMVSSIPLFITNLIIFIYVFSAALVQHEKLLKTVSHLNPLGEKANKKYMQRVAAVTSGMVKGQFVVAVAQGVIGALFIKLAGIDYFIFFAVILSVMSIVPLGGGILTIPLGIIMIITGNIWGGILVLGSHFVIVTNIDNILRPMLVPKSIRLNSALLIISVLSGVVWFGFLGIVIGPVLLIIALTTIEMYIDETSKRSASS